MSETPFQTFIELINFDQAILAAENAVKKLKLEIVAFEKQASQLQTKLEQAKSAAHDARKEVDKLELEMKAFDAAEREKKNRLENSTDYKNYQALKNEIETLKRKQHEYEDVVLNAWNVLEAAQKEFERVKQEHAVGSKELHEAIAKKQEEIAKLEADLVQRKHERIEKEKPVPQEWLEKYALMRARVSDPVVPVLQGACSACVYSVTEQDLLSLRHRKLLQCKGCFRLLYSPELAQGSESAS